MRQKLKMDHPISRHCTVQTLLRNREIVLIRSGNFSVGDNYETPRLLMTADEHVSSNVVNLVNLVSNKFGPPHEETLGGDRNACRVAGAVLLSCSAAFELNPVPSVHSPLVGATHG